MKEQIKKNISPLIKTDELYRVNGEYSHKHRSFEAQRCLAQPTEL